MPQSTGVRRADAFTFEILSDSTELSQLMDQLHQRFPVAPKSDPIGRFTALRLGDGEVNGGTGPALNKRYRLQMEGAHDSHAAHPMGLASVLTSRLTRARLDHEVDRLHLHAAVVTRNDTTAVLLGASGSGKSTLSALLVADGWGYVTDEMVGLRMGDPEDSLHDGVTPVLEAYPKAISLKGDALDLFPQLDAFQRRWSAGDDEPIDRWEIPVELLEGDSHDHLSSRPAPTLPAVPPAGVIVDLTYQPDADLIVEPLPRAEAVQVLVENSMDFRRGGPTSLGSLAAFTGGCHCVRVTYGDVAALTQLLEQLCREPPPPDQGDVHADWRTFSPHPGATSIDVGLDPAMRVAALAHTLVVGDLALAYETAAHNVAVLDAPGLALWELCDGGRSATELAALTATPDASIEFLASLVDLGLLGAC